MNCYTSSGGPFGSIDQNHKSICPLTFEAIPLGIVTFSWHPEYIVDGKQFEKVLVKTGETKRVTFHLTETDFAYYNVMLHKWIVENGRYDIHVCSSSRDIRLTESLLYEDPTCYTMDKLQEDMIG